MLDKPAWDPTNESGLFKKVLNVAAKQKYKARSARFKRLVAEDNNLLAFYSAMDDLPTNPFNITYCGQERQLFRIWQILKEEPQNQCPQCLVYYKKPQPLRVHLSDIDDKNIYCYHFAKPIENLKILHETPMTALMIDDDTFTCNFGCPA